MPILGVIDSAKTGNLWPANSYYQIATTTVGAGGSSSVTFNSIPSTYTHLQIRLIARLSGTGGSQSNTVRFNSDTGNSYRSHFLLGDGTNAQAFETGLANKLYNGIGADADNPSGMFGVCIIDILDYTNTNKNKVTRTLGGADVNGTGGQITLISGLWLNTPAITSISIIPEAGNYVQYSQFDLYGIKVA